ncbi:hypothetical protein LshimejAT787_0700110 [Lyophyllum shimeji]|uniref:Uncharacterized protein n=1 Tax=Lyophyllum shimeji TaxID=47721 RepID=A0A9P3PPP6_LYOSH|nr:hypothetical protein LshimejAT787_0700110 [Lyophyllum shimeji]
MSPIHLPDGQKYHPEEEENVILIFKTYDRQKHHDFLEITTGVNQGVYLKYWKDAYSIRDSNGHEHVCCPGLLYPPSLSIDEARSRIFERLRAYVFPTPPNWRPDSDSEANEEYIDSPRPRGYPLVDWREERDYDGARDAEERRQKEHCVMCADRRTYWAVSPPVFLSRHSRKWHVHVDCLQNFLPRQQFGLKAVVDVDYV